MGSFGPYKLQCEQLPLKKIAFDGKKMLKAIKVYGDISGNNTVTLHFGSNDMSPICIETTGYLYILMPIVVGYAKTSQQKEKDTVPVGVATE